MSRDRDTEHSARSPGLAGNRAGSQGSSHRSDGSVTSAGSETFLAGADGPREHAGRAGGETTRASPVENLLDALRVNGCRPRPSDDCWIAHCPAHDDRSPSLSIGAGDDGRALLHCHAGCSVSGICAALNIAKAELFPDHGNGYTRGAARCAM